MTIFLKGCPFCGGKADFVECPQGSSLSPYSCTWTVGCQNTEVDCIGYQMLAHFNTKQEAADAWNTRAPLTFTKVTLAKFLQERFYVALDEKAENGWEAIPEWHRLRFLETAEKLLAEA